MATVKTIIFIYFFLPFFILRFILKAANRLHSSSGPALWPEHNSSPFPISTKFLVPSRGKRFWSLPAVFKTQFGVLFFFPPSCLVIFTGNCQQLTDTLQIAAAATWDMWNESGGLFVTRKGTFTKKKQLQKSLCVCKVKHLTRVTVCYLFRIKKKKNMSGKKSNK